MYVSEFTCILNTLTNLPYYSHILIVYLVFPVFSFASMSLFILVYQISKNIYLGVSDLKSSKKY